MAELAVFGWLAVPVLVNFLLFIVILMKAIQNEINSNITVRTTVCLKTNQHTFFSKYAVSKNYNFSNIIIGYVFIFMT